MMNEDRDDTSGERGSDGEAGGPAPGNPAATGGLGDTPWTERPLLSFAPMVYIAWADGTLDAGELGAIGRRIGSNRRIDAAARSHLARWLDPESPPSPADLAGLLAEIRRAGRRLGPSRRRSLAQLGVELARSTAGDAVNGGPPAGILEALREVEDALGVVGPEASREILAPPGPKAPDEGVPEPAFDSVQMNRWLDADHRVVRQEVLSLLSEPRFRREPGLGTAAYRERVLEWCRELADRGLGAPAFPPEYGGEGDVTRSIVVFETLAFHDLSLVVKYGVHFGLFGGSIYHLGTRRHHERYLRDVITLDLPGCYAMTETGHGSNVRELETRAEFDPETGEFVIHTPSASARKDYIGNAALHARMATVFAQLRTGEQNHGVHAFLVPIRDARGRPLPGVRIEDCGHKMGLNGVDNGRLSFERVRVPRENLLDRFCGVDADGSYSSPIPSAGRRFFTMLGTLVAGRISIAAAATSAAKTGLAIAVRYAAERRQFGPAGESEIPILDYLLVQRRLLPRLAATYALDVTIHALIRDFAAQPAEGSRDVEVQAAALKAYASRHTVETLQACREACGGQGYLSDNRLGDLKADTDVFTTFEGANDVLLQLVVKGLLTEYREQFGELRIWSAVRYLTARAGTVAAGLNPIAGRRTDRDHLLDPEFHRSALRYREQRLLAGLARRLKRRIDQGQDSFAALNACQDHAVAVARAHVERFVLDRFRDAVAECTDASLGAALRPLCSLYALERIEADRAWFLESGYMEGSKTRAIRALVNEMCAEVRPLAVGLADGFGIPDAVLGAPIALR